ncbi:unnamed protein product [Dovyalis caffra]|uniref:Uncharacterized protein n=1 Tax=Dovyalis caffra TaxID=77055 RepID=A0AAV1SG08_9ROSI|nr:unnamed protein product [Dovyalis caffra]
MKNKKQLIQNEEKELLPVVIDYQPNVSSPSPRTVLNAILEESRNSSQNNLIGFENMPSNDTAKLSSKLQGSSSSSGPGSTSDKENSIMEETNDADMLDSFFKCLDINKTVPLDFEQSQKATKQNAVQTNEALTQIISEIIIPNSKSEQITSDPHKELGKVLDPEMLAEIAKHDPKMAERIVTNWMSALEARDKEELSAFMLEHMTESSLAESVSLSAYFEREIRCLEDEKTKMQEQIEMTLQEIHMQEAMNNEMREEIQRLKMLWQKTPHCGRMFNSMNGCEGHNLPAADASLDTTKYGDNDADEYFDEYEVGQSSESQKIQQQYPLQVYYQGQDKDEQSQGQEPCIVDPNTEESRIEEEQSDKD